MSPEAREEGQGMKGGQFRGRITASRRLVSIVIGLPLTVDKTPRTPFTRISDHGFTLIYFFYLYFCKFFKILFLCVSFFFLELEDHFVNRVKKNCRGGLD